MRTTGTDILQPDDEKVADVFARLGYRFADAIADIVDNSVDAGADSVHVRFVKSQSGIHSVLIADNGSGMSVGTLREAMRFGSRTSKTGKQLGKYGIGLKSASLSQADVVSVLSRCGEEINGRRWSIPNVKRGWHCDILHSEDVKSRLRENFGSFTLSHSGTLVIWEKLEHLKALPVNVDKVLANTTKELKTELGIRFHRFIESGRLTISIDQQLLGDEATGIHVTVEAFNPFSYDASPNANYPITIPLIVAGTKVPVQCHIWPPKSNAPGYRLGGGKVALRQGFYFYRNDRLIQAGGWNGARADDGEPHLSLARVLVELPDALDALFKLEVTKMGLDPTPEFMQALYSATGKGGMTFEKYLADAQAAYRKQKQKDGARFPLVPGDGLSKPAQRAIGMILKETGSGKPETVRFKWSRLDADELFRLHSADQAILLNSRYKSELLEGGGPDAPVLKVALMFLLQDLLLKQFTKAASEEWVQKVNQALIAALKS